MIRLFKALWRGAFDVLINTLSFFRSLGNSKHWKDKDDVDGRIDLWPYDLVMEKGLKDRMMEDTGGVTLEYQGEYVVGVVVGYVKNRSDLVKVAYINCYEIGKPLIKTVSIDKLEAIDSPIKFLSTMALTQQELPELFNSYEVEEPDDGDSGGGEIVH